MANQDLKWETTITRNLGLDFTLLNSRLWGTVDVYWNTTKDLLMLTDIPSIYGFTTTYANIGQTSNKGVEFSLSGVVFKNKDWNITAGANINFNRGSCYWPIQRKSNERLRVAAGIRNCRLKF